MDYMESFQSGTLMETLHPIYHSIQSIPARSRDEVYRSKKCPEQAKSPGVDARNLSDTAIAQLVHIILKFGKSLKKHITPVDVIFYVLAGDGVVEIGEEKKEVGQDTLIESPISSEWNSGKGCYSRGYHASLGLSST